MNIVINNQIPQPFEHSPSVSTVVPGGFQTVMDEIFRDSFHISEVDRTDARTYNQDSNYAIEDSNYAIEDSNYAIEDSNYATEDSNYAIEDSNYATEDSNYATEDVPRRAERGSAIAEQETKPEHTKPESGKETQTESPHENQPAEVKASTEDGKKTTEATEKAKKTELRELARKQKQKNTEKSDGKEQLITLASDQEQELEAERIISTETAQIAQEQNRMQGSEDAEKSLSSVKEQKQNIPQLKLETEGVAHEQQIVQNVKEEEPLLKRNKKQLAKEQKIQQAAQSLQSGKQSEAVAETKSPSEKPLFIIKEDGQETTRNPFSRAFTVSNLPQQKIDGDAFKPRFAQLLRTQLTNQIVKQASIIFERQDAGEIRMLLQPKEFGELRVRLQLENNTVLGKIIVDNQVVRSVVEENMASLEDAFIGQGFQLEGMEVSVRDDVQEEMEEFVAQSYERSSIGTEVAEMQYTWQDGVQVNLVL